MTNELRNPAQKLWQDQPVEGITMSAEIIRKRAAKFERKILWRNVREYVAALIAAVPLGYFLVTARDVFARVTFGLLIAIRNSSPVAPPVHWTSGGATLLGIRALSSG